MNARPRARRLAGIIVHNWPLKLAAVVLATLLYAGLVASQDSSTYPGPDRGHARQPAGTARWSRTSSRTWRQIRYLAPADVPVPGPGDFLATVDLSDVEPDGNPVTVRVDVTPNDPRITIIGIRPATISVTLDEDHQAVQVVVDIANPPDRLQLGEVTVTPTRSRSPGRPPRSTGSSRPG